MIHIYNIVQRSGYGVAQKFCQLKDLFPAQTFMPNKPQADLIRAVGTMSPPYGKKRIFLVTSSNRAGKTYAAINICLNLIYPGLNVFNYVKDVQTGEEYPGFFNYPLYKKFPDWPHRIWYVSNQDSLKAIQKKFWEWLHPTDTIEKKEGKTAFAGSFQFHSNDWEIQFKTIDQDPKTFESADVGIVIFDEPPPYRLFTAAVGRMSGGGIIIIPATPLFEAAWFVDEIIDKVDVDGDKYHQTVNIWTNCIEKAGEWDLGPWGIQKKGNLWKDNIDFMIRNWDPDEVEARRDGVFKFLTGLVYKTYDKAVHMLDRHISPSPTPLKYMYRMIIDPHDRRPPAVIWVRLDSYGRRIILREWPSHKDKQYNGLPFHKIKSADPYTIRDFVKIFADIERDLEIPQSRIRRIMDPLFGKKPIRTTGRTVQQEYCIAAAEVLKQQWSFAVNLFDKADEASLAAGHKAVKELLKPMADGDYPLLIGHDCHNVDYGFRHYSYDELTPKMAEKKEISQVVREIGKDFMDLVRYDAMTPFTYDELMIHRDPYEPTDYEEVFEETDWREKFKPVPPRPAGAKGV